MECTNTLNTASINGAVDVNFDLVPAIQDRCTGGNNKHGRHRHYEDGRQHDVHAGVGVTYTVVVSNAGLSDAVGSHGSG